MDQILINAYPGNNQYLIKRLQVLTHSLLVYAGDTERGELGLAIMSGRRDEFRESLEKAMEYATALNCNKYCLNLSNFDNRNILSR